MDFSNWPSAYVAFETIFASDQCGIVGSALYRSTTLAFDQNDVSTANPYGYNPLLHVGARYVYKPSIDCG
jgi:hypothetical protein